MRAPTADLNYLSGACTERKAAAFGKNANMNLRAGALEEGVATVADQQLLSNSLSHLCF